MGTARALVAESAVSWAERTARVPRPSLRSGASMIVLIRPSPGLRWIQKNPGPLVGEGRGGVTCRRIRLLGHRSLSRPQGAAAPVPSPLGRRHMHMLHIIRTRAKLIFVTFVRWFA